VNPDRPFTSIERDATPPLAGLTGIAAAEMTSTTRVRTVLRVAGRDIAFMGDEGDSYFNGLGAFQAGSTQFEGYVRKNLARNAVSLDIGANIGLTAILLALCCPDGEVYAIEASPRNARNLRENLRHNDIRNCFVVETAVGWQQGMVSFREAPFSAGSHVAACSPAFTGDASIVSVPVVTLDSLADRPPLLGKRIDFIKLDVEGFEPAVLAGASRLLERNPIPIFMEFNSWCLQFLHGFSPFVLASALAQSFELSTIDAEGNTSPFGDGVGGFLFRNILQKGCVDDILMRLKPGAQVPSFEEMTKSAEDLQTLRELRRAQREIEALRMGGQAPMAAPPRHSPQYVGSA
jgi:FkbM family methyltransferase